MKKIITILLMGMLCLKSFGQNKREMVIGKVSFVTSQNVYVKFESTEKIHIGDSLKFVNQIKPCLLVQNKSSKSLVCVRLNECELKKGDAVYYYYDSEKIISEIKPKIVQTKKIKNKPKNDIKTPNKSLENVYGKFSIKSYSNLSALYGNYHRLRYTFSLDAERINNSKFSFETYLNYNQYLPLKDTTRYQRKNAFYAYDFSIKYDATPTLSAVLGRKINNKMSSIGAIDGLQVEKKFGKNYAGLIAGFRPNILDYGFNSKLMEVGGYVGRSIDTKNINSETTIGIIRQNNNGNIDRQYAYFQHSSNIFSNLSLFSSIEADMYHKVNGQVAYVIKNITNLYFSARYRFNRNVSLMLSYDSRKNIIYYETYQTEIERLLNDNEARQGFRMRLNFRPLKGIYAGISYSKRFQSLNQNKSNNMNAYISSSYIPIIGGRLSLNYNNNTSNYLKSNIFSIRHSRELIPSKLSADFYFRKVNYNYFGNGTISKQNYFGTNLSLKISKSLRLNIFGELSTSKDLQNNYRINTSIIKRFNNKKR